MIASAALPATTQLADPATLRPRRPGQLLNAVPVAHEARRRLLRLREPLRVHNADRLREVAAELNNRPREVLGWKTPAELLEQLKSTPANVPALR